MSWTLFKFKNAKTFLNYMKYSTLLQIAEEGFYSADALHTGSNFRLITWYCQKQVWLPQLIDLLCCLLQLFDVLAITLQLMSRWKKSWIFKYSLLLSFYWRGQNCIEIKALKDSSITYTSPVWECNVTPFLCTWQKYV